MRRPKSSFSPFAARGRGTAVGILSMFAVFSALSVGLSIRETSRSHHRATVVEIAGRQRTLAERYVRETMLVQNGGNSDPATTASLLRDSAKSLINGGVAPAVNGDDDETALPRADRAGPAPVDPGATAGQRPDRDGKCLAGRPAARWGEAHGQREARIEYDPVVASRCSRR